MKRWWCRPCRSLADVPATERRVCGRLGRAIADALGNAALISHQACDASCAVVNGSGELTNPVTRWPMRSVAEVMAASRATASLVAWDVSLGKLLDLRRDDSKASALFANPRSFDRRVERQKIGLGSTTSPMRIRCGRSCRRPREAPAVRCWLHARSNGLRSRLWRPCRSRATRLRSRWRSGSATSAIWAESCR